MLLFAFLPLPLFDLVGLACGAAKMPLRRYIPACFVGKLLKMSCFVLAAHGMLPIFFLCWEPEIPDFLLSPFSKCEKRGA